MPGEAERLTVLVASHFAALRAASGMSLASVASLAGLHPSTVHLIEQGKRGLSLGSALRLARAFGVRLSDVIAAAEDDL